ncbi:MAG TPA: hypothetical protein VFZ91_01675, partial [Allosphingosinicella sp.]
MNSENQAGPPRQTASDVQAHLLRAAKMPVGPQGEGYETRNWSLFFFFRIMQQAEMRETVTRLAAVASQQEPAEPPARQGSPGFFLKDKTGSPSRRLKLDLAFPSVLNGGLVGQAKSELRHPRPGSAALADQAIDPDAPAQAFLNWLKVLVNGDGEDLKAEAAQFAADLNKAGLPREALFAASGVPPGAAALNALAQKMAADFQADDLHDMLGMAVHVEEVLDFIRGNYQEVMAAVRSSIAAPAGNSPHGPLARMILYELLRQAAPIFAPGPVLPVLRSEATESRSRSGPEPFDQTPITMAFSFSGLEALKLHANTLHSFPEAFKEGLAARARRLGDVGRSAPEYWEGELGLRNVHGFFTGGSNLAPAGPLSESFWKSLRREIRLFNDPAVDDGSELRAWIGLLFRLLGLEIVHIELGQDPYRVDYKANPDGEVVPLTERKEHFGFRDGLSQPFVDVGVGDTVPGGGTADRRGTWTPVAPGEIFLDREDESGQSHRLPIHADLRAGSTYLVFRKLEQDVEGFRAFLSQQRPDDTRAQDKLAAEFFGRWPNGTSLVHSPNSQRSTACPETEAALNDFRYAADDPFGRKCPLGAHVRRANPRDIGGRNDVRHHRILRRGIAYGGPLLTTDTPEDGERRGILFIAVNARIDLQFEVVQGDWLNSGEFLG